MRIAPVALIVAAVLATGTAAAAPSARMSYERGKALYAEGNYEDAAPLFVDAYRISSKPLLLFNAAQAYRKAGRRDEAVAALQWFLEQSQKEDPNVVEDARALLALLEHPPATSTALDSSRPTQQPPDFQPRPPAWAEPRPPQPWAEVQSPASPTPDPQNVPGWALGAAVQGIIFSSLTLSLGMAAESYRSRQIPGLPLGIVTTLIFVIDTPLSAAGAASTRNQAGVAGMLGLRVTGWIAFGLAAVGAVALIGVGASNVEPPPGVVAVTTLLGTAGNLFLSIDGVVAWQQARARRPPRVTWTSPTSFRF